MFVCGNQLRPREAFVSTVIGGEVEKTMVLSTGDDSSRWISVVICNKHGTLVVTGHEDGSVHLWNAQTGQVIGNALNRHEGPVRCVALSADGKLVASGSWDRTVRILGREDLRACG